MKAHISISAIGLSLVLLAGGCASSRPNFSLDPDSTLAAVWNSGPQQSVLSQEPVALRLFFSQQRHDLLVVYDEYPLGNSPMRTHAYWLYESEDNLGRNGHMSFVKTNAALSLIPVPVLSTTTALATNSPDTLSVIATNDYTFTVYSGQREVSSHSLPIHFVRPGNSLAEKILLTPFAIEVDSINYELEHVREP